MIGPPQQSVLFQDSEAKADPLSWVGSLSLGGRSRDVTQLKALLVLSQKYGCRRVHELTSLARWLGATPVCLFI